METTILMFDADAYEREKLDKMSAEELEALARRDYYESVLAYDLDTFCRLCNNDAIGVENCWIYSIELSKD